MNGNSETHSKGRSRKTGKERPKVTVYIDPELLALIEKDSVREERSVNSQIVWILKKHYNYGQD